MREIPPLPDNCDFIPYPIGEETLHKIYEQNAQPISAVPTMLPTWNKMCGDEGGRTGLAHGWHVVVAGKTGSGKSLMGLNIAVAAMRKGHKVAYLSLEMSLRQLITRTLSILSDIPVSVLEPGKTYDEVRYKKAADEWLEVMKDLMFVNEAPIRTAEEIEIVILKLHQLFGVRYFITDYLQLAWTKAEGMNAQITEVSNTVRGLARELNVVSVGLSQYNRETSKSKDRPDVTGLMGASSLENDADQVILLDHTSYKKGRDQSATQEILLGKNRHGSIGRVAVQWDFKTLRIMEAYREEANGSKGDAWEEQEPDLPF